MQQIIKNSQTPSFEKNKSCTTAILFQHPTAQEQRTSFLSVLFVNIREFVLFTVFSIVAWLLITVLLTTAFGA